MEKINTEETERDNYYSEDYFEYDDTGYDNLYLINVDTTFDDDFEYIILLE